MGKGNTRNKPCFCGSGLKYKNYHGKPNKEHIKLYELDKELKSSYTIKKCMTPKELHKECSKRIIKAHTISKSNNLKEISINGHVYTFKKTLQELDKNNGVFPVEKIGINNASIFYGFCSIHDKKLFSDIENEPIIFSDKQIFLLAYRSIANELYLKLASLDYNKKMLKHKSKISPSMPPLLDLNITMLEEGTKTSIRDLEFIKQFYDYSLLNNQFSGQMNYYMLIINKIPEIVNSAGWIPTIDFDNNELADLLEKDIKYNTLTMNTIRYNDKGAIIFSWHKKLECENCLRFIQSLHNIENKYKSYAILKWLFECNENIYWSIKWWDTLDEKFKNILIDNMMNIMRKQNLSDYKTLEGALEWDIIDIKTNLNI